MHKHHEISVHAATVAPTTEHYLITLPIDQKMGQDGLPLAHAAVPCPVIATGYTLTTWLHEALHNQTPGSSLAVGRYFLRHCEASARTPRQ